MNVVRWLVWLGTVLAIGSCIEQIPVELDQLEQFIVIEGSITDDKNTQIVNVSRSSDFRNAPGFMEPIVGAKVSIFDDLDQEFELREMKAGVYTATGLTGQVGRSYYVEVNISNRTYRSLSEKLLTVPDIKNVKIISASEKILGESENIITKPLVKVLVSVDMPDDLNNTYLRWNLSGEYRFTDAGFFPSVCYVPVNFNLNNIAVFGDQKAVGKVLSDFEILSLDVNFHFSNAYCFHIEQESITRSAYEFWTKTNQLITRKGGLFEAPPGRVVGNIYNVNDDAEYVFGFFSASSIKKTIQCVRPYEIDGAYASRCESSTFDFTNTDPNCYCATITNSVPSRPSYWP